VNNKMDLHFARASLQNRQVVSATKLKYSLPTSYAIYLRFNCLLRCINDKQSNVRRQRIGRLPNGRYGDRVECDGPQPRIYS
jgi:hypothetical protein